METPGSGYHMWPVSQCLLVLGLLGGLGCGGGATIESATGGPPPSWLTNLPEERGKLCAMGVSGPTYFPEDAIVNSKTQGLGELGRSLKSQVKSQLLVQEHGGSGHDSVEVRDAVALSSDEILKLAEVKSRWVNPGGYPTAGTKGTVYTLICTPI